MKTTLLLLTSLALAAAACAADPYSSASSSTYVRAEVSMATGVTLAPIVHEQYRPRRNPLEINYFDPFTGDRVGPTNADIGYDFGSTGRVNAANDVVTMSVDATMDLFPTATTQDTYAYSILGHRAFFTFTNDTGANADVTFKLIRSGSFTGHADRPSNPAGDNYWDYAGSDTAGGGLAPVDADNNVIGTSYYDETYGWTYNFGTGTILKDLNGHLDLTNQTYTYTIGAGQSRFEVWAVAATEVGYINPVPEPASMAALGLGTLALLRRRRKA